MSPQLPACSCHQCLLDRDERVEVMGLSVPVSATQMIVCAICGNKRCPHANDHRNDCSHSNDTSQIGSAYP